MEAYSTSVKKLVNAFEGEDLEYAFTGALAVSSIPQDSKSKTKEAFFVKGK